MKITPSGNFRQYFTFLVSTSVNFLYFFHDVKALWGISFSVRILFPSISIGVLNYCFRMSYFVLVITNRAIMSLESFFFPAKLEFTLYTKSNSSSNDLSC